MSSLDGADPLKSVHVVRLPRRAAQFFLSRGLTILPFPEAAQPSPLIDLGEIPVHLYVHMSERSTLDASSVLAKNVENTSRALSLKDLIERAKGGIHERICHR